MNHYRAKIIIGLLLLLVNVALTAQINQLHDYTDHHVHLQDSATEQLGYRMLKAMGQKPTRMDSLVLDANTIIARLNKAKFKSAWILSNAYWFGSPMTSVENEYEAVKKQNDWTAEQAARYPERLTAFMSVNPLKPYALEEIQRCVDSKRFAGIKLHFANSKVNLFNKTHLTQLLQVFALANKNKLMMIIHFRNGQQWDGKANVKILFNELMPFAKNTPVVIAHLAGWGGYDQPMHEALQLFADYIHQKNAHHNNLYLEVSAVLPLTLSGDDQPTKDKANRNEATALTQRIKQIGSDHLLFGTDWPLIDIDAYIQLLNTTLGVSVVDRILRNKIGDD